MTDHFDEWINSMTDNEYSNWLEDEATEAQEEKALNIREAPTDEELEDIEDEQTFPPQIEQAFREAPKAKKRSVISFLKRVFRL